MEQIPDAPWIRKAETDGVGDPPVHCPCCEEECTTIYRDQWGNVFACNKCIEEQDAWEWAEEERLASRPDWKE